MVRRPAKKQAEPRDAKPQQPAQLLELYVHDLVRFKGNDTVYEVTHVSQEGREADVAMLNTNLEAFRVPAYELELARWKQHHLNLT